MGEVKYRIFLLTGGLLALAQLALKYLTAASDIQWDVRVENITLTIIMAWIAERYAQRKLGISLNWLGSGVRHTRLFMLSILGWGGGMWLAMPGILESQSIFRFYVNAAILYLFAGAFFEICNLIKIGVKQ